MRAGQTNITIDIPLKDVYGDAATGLTIADLDASYRREGAAQSTPTALTAHSAITDAHSDYYAFEISSTNAPGSYRVDWPDAAFATGARYVTLFIVGAAILPIHIVVELVDEPYVTGTISDSVPGTDSFALDSTFSSTDDFYNNMYIVLTSGDAAPVARKITDYDGSSKTITLASALPAAPSDGDPVMIIGAA